MWTLYACGLACLHMLHCLVWATLVKEWGGHVMVSLAAAAGVAVVLWGSVAL